MLSDSLNYFGRSGGTYDLVDMNLVELADIIDHQWCGLLNDRLADHATDLRGEPEEKNGAQNNDDFQKEPNFAA